MLGILRDLVTRTLTLGAVQESDLPTLLLPEPGNPVASEPSLLASIVRMLGALGLVLALLILTLWLLRRLSQQSANRRAVTGAGGIDILQQRSLGGRRHLAVVRWEGRRLLLGMTADSITALAEAPDEAPAEHFDGALDAALGGSARR